MVSTKMKKGALVGLLALIGLTLAASPAAAQPSTDTGQAQTNTQVTATPPSEPIRPLSGLKNIQVTVTYNHQQGGYAFVSTPVEITVTNSPSWITATVTPSTVYMPISEDQSNAEQRTIERQTTLVVQTTAEAPAFQQGNIDLEASSQQNGDLQPSTGTTSVPVQAGFYSVIDAQTPKPVVIAGPQEQIDFPLKVSNFGNGDQTIFLETSQASKDLDIVLPGAFTVSSQVSGEDNSRTSTVSVQTPFQNGYINKPGTFSLDVNSAYALDQSNTGMSTRVSALITTKGFFVPGPGALASLAAFAGVALALTRRRDL